MCALLPSKFNYLNVIQELIPDNITGVERIQVIGTLGALIEPYFTGDKDEEELRKDLEDFFKVLLEKDDVNQEVEKVMRVVKIEKRVRTARPPRRAHRFSL